MTELSATPALSLPRPAAELLPHRPPMLFVEALIARHGDRSTVQAVLPTIGICVSDGWLLPEYFIELIAQAAALGSGYDGLCSGKPVHDGMLVGIDGFSSPGLAVPGRTVRIETEITFKFGAIKLIHGEVYDDQKLLAAGDIKVWEDLGGDATR